MTSHELGRILSTEANRNGGWGYFPGKSSRIEPTCWALLALGDGASDATSRHYQFLTGCQRPDGLLSDRPDQPANLSWTALAFLTASTFSPSDSIKAFCDRSLQALVGTSGVQLDNSPHFRQDNKRQGWPWIPDTFSWIEPTSWCLIALKKARARSGSLPSALARRVTDGEAVLIDRACDSGGWNYGNANVFGTSLPAHVPTSALGLIALQDKSHIPAVQRALNFLETNWRKELSGAALALSLMCLRLYGRETAEIEKAVHEQWQRTRFLGNFATTSMAWCALAPNSRAINAFTLP